MKLHIRNINSGKISREGENAGKVFWKTI